MVRGHVRHVNMLRQEQKTTEVKHHQWPTKPEQKKADSHTNANV